MGPVTSCFAWCCICKQIRWCWGCWIKLKPPIMDSVCKCKYHQHHKLPLDYNPQIWKKSNLTRPLEHELPPLLLLPAHGQPLPWGSQRTRNDPPSLVPLAAYLKRSFIIWWVLSYNHYYLSTLVLSTYNETVVFFVGFWQVGEWQAGWQGDRQRSECNSKMRTIVSRT